MNRTATAVAIAESLALPAMKLLATLNVLFLISFIAVVCTAVAH